MGIGQLVRSFVIDPQAQNILQAGVGADSRMVIMERSSIASYTLNALGEVTAITFNTGFSAWSIDGIRQSLKPKFERVQAPSGQSVFRHSVSGSYFDYSSIAKNNSLRMSNSRYVVIYENSKLDGNAIEVMGLDVGLEITELTRAPQENGGAIMFTLSSPENEFEARPPATWNSGAGVYATNRTAVDALLFLPTIGAGGLSILSYPAATPTAIVITGTNFFGGGVNNGVLKVELVNNDTGSIIPFTATLTVTSTTISVNTPATGEGAGKSYKVKVTTIKGIVYSQQNIVTT